MKEDLLKIINHYGVSHQLKKLSEEVFEFQEAVLNYEDEQISKALLEFENLDSSVEKKQHIIEELSDIMVLLNQFIAYYDLELDLDKIDKTINEKVARQLKRIEAENDNN